LVLIGRELDRGMAKSPFTAKKVTLLQRIDGGGEGNIAGLKCCATTVSGRREEKTEGRGCEKDLSAVVLASAAKSRERKIAERCP